MKVYHVNVQPGLTKDCKTLCRRPIFPEIGRYNSLHASKLDQAEAFFRGRRMCKLCEKKVPMVRLNLVDL